MKVSDAMTSQVSIARPTDSIRQVAQTMAKVESGVVPVVEDGKVVDFAQDVSACALGQAAAAILGQNVIGADLSDIELARDSLAAMLKANGSPPAGRFAELAVLEPVKDYPARHASTLLAFEATVEAVRKATGAGETRTSTAGAA